jgi:hypothetical protein
MNTLKNFLLLAAAAVAMFGQAGAPVQTKNNISMYYWIYPAAVTGVSLPGQVPAGTGQSGVAVAVQSSDPAVTGFVVTLTYVDPNSATQTTIHKFAAVSGDYATEMFPVGAITSVTSIGVIPTVDQQEVVFGPSPSSGTDASAAAAAAAKKRAQRRNN